MVLLFLEMTHLNLCEQRSRDTAEEEVPCMDDAGEPPEDPEREVYPDTCSDVQVRGQCVHWDETTRCYSTCIASRLW